MAHSKVIMPQMGESVAEGTVAKWLKVVGDKVERDENILEINTDKIDVEIPSPQEGFLRAILAREGETVDVGSPVAIISDSPDEEIEGLETIPETEKAVEESTKDSAIVEPTEKIEAKTTVSKTEISAKDKRKFYTPVVLKIATEKEINLEEITGTGLGGRVTKKDVLRHLKEGPAPTVETVKPDTSVVSRPQTGGTAKPAAVISFAEGADVEVIPMSNVRKKTADHMTMSKRTSAHVHSMQEVDMTSIVGYRNSIKDDFRARNGFPLSFMAIITKEVAEAIRLFPLMNSSVAGDKIVVKKNVNIGMAVALPDDTLIVPVIKNADHLSVKGISGAIWDLAQRARNRKLRIEDIEGGTFTITNHGVFGSLFGNPIINQPQVAILGTGAMQKRVVVSESSSGDSIAIRTMMYLSLGYDHRIIDGSYGGRFAAEVAKKLETWTPDRL